MKTPRLRTRLPRLVLAALLLCAGPILAQFPPAPGPEHEAMKKLEGTWSAKVKAGDSESDGTMTIKSECGGLWLSTDFQGDMGGQKFQGRGLDGYDPGKKKYISVWVDSFSTQPIVFEGTMNKEKKTLTLNGEGPGPDGKPMKYKSETVYTDNDHLSFSMYLVDADGKENKMLSIGYTRKK